MHKDNSLVFVRVVGEAVMLRTPKCVQAKKCSNCRKWILNISVLSHKPLFRALIFSAHNPYLGPSVQFILKLIRQLFVPCITSGKICL